jgi:pimeloyl-ACP methyl ester carboxylesterase
VAGLLSLAAVGWGYVYFFPLQIAEISNRYEFWKEGIQNVSSGGLHGYLADRCAGTLQQACVALVHGLADSAETWKKILIWPANGWLEPVKLYAFDLPGVGGSAAPLDPRAGYRVRNQARKLREALAGACPKWVVVGNSLGGWVASWLALDWPEGVSRLILLDSAGLKSSADPKELEAFKDPTVATLKEFQRRAYYKGRPLPDNVWAAAVRRMRDSNAREVLEAQTPEDYLDGRISTLRRPTMLLWGAADQITPETQGKALQSLIPGSVWVEAPECGHLPQKECPLQVIRAIAKMIDFGAA